jgi:TolA-binding protein
MRMPLFLLWQAVFILLAVGTQLPILASECLNKAMEEYRLRRFHAASDLFQKTIKQEPANTKAYYWLGQTLEQLKDRSAAKAMYEACFKLDPFGPEALPARAALNNLVNSMAILGH